MFEIILYVSYLFALLLYSTIKGLSSFFILDTFANASYNIDACMRGDLAATPAIAAISTSFLFFSSSPRTALVHVSVSFSSGAVLLPHRSAIFSSLCRLLGHRLVRRLPLLFLSSRVNVHAREDWAQKSEGKVSWFFSRRRLPTALCPALRSANSSPSRNPRH